MRRGAPSAPGPLTQRQHDFMLALQRRMAADPDRGVSYDELRQDLGMGSKSGISRLVDECVERGRIARTRQRPRSLRVIAPVAEGVAPYEAPPRPSIESFSDAEIIVEAARRGLLQSTS